MILGAILLVLAALFVHWILKHDTLRWIFALVGFLVFCGWLASHCGGLGRHASMGEPVRYVTVGPVVEQGYQPPMLPPVETPFH